MTVIDELVSQIEDPALRARITAEVDKMAKQKKFGLVFEEHLPECTPLWDIPVKKGSKVALKAGQVSDFNTVLRIEDGKPHIECWRQLLLKIEQLVHSSVFRIRIHQGIISSVNLKLMRFILKCS